MIYDCADCDKLFYAGRVARDQHCQATGHAPPQFECDTCNFCFDDEYDRCDHMSLEMHWGRGAPECRFCFVRAVTDAEIKEHESTSHNYCADCDRQFLNLNNVQQHLKSKIHRTTIVNCPFCRVRCGTATGLSHHLERGSCPRIPFNRDKLYRYIKHRDPAGLISNKEIEWSGEKTYSINPRAAWNPWVKAFECYLCHKLYMSLNGLRQHLESPRHQQSLYHCFNGSCRKEFKTLAALINHLESESCRVMRFQQVQTTISNIVDARKMISNP
ncbi:hypothetical protein KAF25_010723 [Fusarium avenaceum]|uniref:C2H2-type domain-containing protein n=1 Tax=Fusarium avenaceum TaxID=40199 RepID=A0A9P7H561_9HYPO|nr:hypothetical protein KAF25_010723 [Fusarium avenaceum]